MGILAAYPTQRELPLSNWARFSWRNERLDQAVLVITQRLAGPKIPNQNAICRRPHSGLPAGEPPGRHHHSSPALVKLTRRPFQNGLLASFRPQTLRVSTVCEIVVFAHAGADGAR